METIWLMQVQINYFIDRSHIFYQTFDLICTCPDIETHVRQRNLFKKVFSEQKTFLNTFVQVLEADPRSSVYHLEKVLA